MLAFATTRFGDHANSKGVVSKSCGFSWALGESRICQRGVASKEARKRGAHAMASTVAIALIATGSVLVAAAVVYMAWPLLRSVLRSLWSPKTMDASQKDKEKRRSPATELPPLITPA